LAASEVELRYPAIGLVFVTLACGAAAFFASKSSTPSNRPSILHANEMSVDGVTLTSNDVQDFERAQLEKAANGQDTSDIVLPRVAEFRHVSACFPSLWGRPFSDFSFYVRFYADRAPFPEERNSRYTEKKISYCLQGVQVITDDRTTPSIRGYATSLSISDFEKKDCAALPASSFFGLDIFCFYPDHQRLEAAISVPSTEPQQLEDGTEIFGISDVIVDHVQTSLRTVPEGSPTCNEFHRRFGEGNCDGGPFSADGHSILVRLQNGSLTFILTQCLGARATNGGCLDHRGKGLILDALQAIKNKKAESAPPPSF
jgi:hypothetical protein